MTQGEMMLTAICKIAIVGAGAMGAAHAAMFSKT
jgi:3-hydroxyacyl-CoA dehydrogenase